MTVEEAMKQGEELMKHSTLALIGTKRSDGFPNIKAMFSREVEGIKTCWFSTNTSSKRVAQLRNDPQACVYFFDAQNFRGLMLVGTIEILEDDHSRKRIWRDGDEIYYSQGFSDSDYSVLKFTAIEGNYYHGLSNITFTI